MSTASKASFPDAEPLNSILLCSYAFSEIRGDAGGCQRIRTNGTRQTSTLVVSVALCFLNSRSLQISSKNLTRVTQQLGVNSFPLQCGILTQFHSVSVFPQSQAFRSFMRSCTLWRMLTRFERAFCVSPQSAALRTPFSHPTYVDTRAWID